MPKLDTKLHLSMLRRGKLARMLPLRLKKAVEALVGRGDVYGLEWGDPEVLPPLRYVRDHFLVPYVSPRTTVPEIGPGGGRWTRYMLAAERIYAVDYHQELLDELRSTLRAKNIVYVKNNGDDFPNVPDSSIDFLFAFGVFVHLDLEIIDAYLRNMKRVLAPNSDVVLQYSDIRKPLARANKGFADNDPERMRALVLDHGYAVHEEDTRTMWHSSIIRFGPSARDQ